ncbi:MAG: hypothetical protein NVS3B20_11330 [Polyangiales bacterium]
MLRLLIGLAATIILAIFAAHPRVRKVENRFGLTLAVASGLPFLLIGALFQHPSIGVLDESTLKELSPFVEFGLGWVGFLLGLEFDVRRLDDLPDGIGAALAVEAIVPFLFASTLATAAISLLRVAGHEGSWSDPISLRNGLIIGACAALSAATAPLALARGAGRTVARILDRIAQLDDVAGLIVLLVVSAFFRPVVSVDWQVPAIGWLFVAIGFGGVLGMLSYTLIRGAQSAKEELAFTLGAVCFCAGVSGRLGFSPLVVCAVSGALLANLPRRRGSRLVVTLRTVERPAYLLFMLFAGATLPFTAWQGWVLMPIYVLARVCGKILGVRAARRVGPRELRNAPGVELALMPQSQMGVAVMLAATTLYVATKDKPLGWIFLAVVVGGYINDVGTQFVAQHVNRISSDTIDLAAKSIYPDASHPRSDDPFAEANPVPESEADRKPTVKMTPGAFPIPPPPPIPRIPTGSTERE